MTQNPSQPFVSIIVLNYNAGKLLINCVESILKTNYPKFEIIVVDNVSNDHSHKECKKTFPQIRLIENMKNLGYCEGNNVGIRAAKGDFLVILNPDTIVSPEWLHALVDAYEKNGEGIYQPKILSLYESGVLQSTGNMLHLFGFGFSRDKGILDNSDYNEIQQVGYASGTCLFMSLHTMTKIGLFDPFIFLYHDDLDLGWRAAQLNIKSYFVPSSVIYHAESYSLKWSSKKFFWLERNRRYCLLTHYSKKTYKKILPSLIIVEIMVWFFYMTKGFFIEKIKAELEIFKNRTFISQKYAELESKKLVPDEELIKLFPDEIFVPQNVSNRLGSKMFNSILSYLSKNAKKSILS